MIFYVFKFSMSIANNTMDFYSFNILRIYLKHFNILSLFSYLLGENKLVHSIANFYLLT